MAAPKTMDNDVFGTDYCMGFSTAVSRSVEAIHALRTPAGSHERIAVIELFGRNSGETALLSGYLTDADRTLISEVPFDIGRLAALLEKDRAANPSRYAVLVLSEGAQMREGEIVEQGQEDAYGHRKLGGIGEMVGAEITAPHRHRRAEPEAGLSDAQRSARRARPDGGEELRHHGGAASGGGKARADDRDPGRPLYHACRSTPASRACGGSMSRPFTTPRPIVRASPRSRPSRCFFIERGQTDSPSANGGSGACVRACSAAGPHGQPGEPVKQQRDQIERREAEAHGIIFQRAAQHRAHQIVGHCRRQILRCP